MRGFNILGPRHAILRRTATLFLPDIDSTDRWKAWALQVDVAFGLQTEPQFDPSRQRELVDVPIPWKFCGCAILPWRAGDALTCQARSLCRSSLARRLPLWSTAIAIASVATGGISLHARAEAEVPDASAEVAIEDLPEGESVEFSRDVLPLLERSCLACHSASTAEADVVLESVESMLTYDAEDPLIVPGDASAGKLLQVAAGLQEPTMPPEDNDVGAARLTPFELGQIKRWIELGAQGSSDAPSEHPIHWRPIQSDRAPIMAAAVTSREAFALAAHGNAVEIYNLAQGRRETSLVDASLRESRSETSSIAAHLDAVRSLATFDNGDQIATGGYRTVKLWRRVRTKQDIAWPASTSATALATTPNRDWIATGHEDGSVVLGRRDSRLERRGAGTLQRSCRRDRRPCVRG